MKETRPKDEASVTVKHKLINNMPFLEVTLMLKEQTQDRGVFAIPAERNLMNKVINNWMYYDNETTT
jgi:hypothetical protein